MINPLRLILMPFAWLYGAVTNLRNRLFDLGLKPSTEFDVAVIAVGNLSVGGTGKTPMTEYLLRILRPVGRLAFLSRGYGRRTRGFRIATMEDSAASIGDEPLQVFRKCSSYCVIAVAEERALGITRVMDEYPDVKAVVLDDAFQHRTVRPRLSILLTTYQRPFYDDSLLPAGRLRESSGGAKRADVIVVTKCPTDITDVEMQQIHDRISPYTAAPAFFSCLDYDAPKPIGSQEERSPLRVILVTGVANTQPLVNHLLNTFEIVRHFRFSDHHVFQLSDLEQILKTFRESKAESIFTTEKDAMRLMQPVFSHFLDAAPWYFIPVKPVFIKNGEEFDAIVNRAVLS